MCNIDYCVHLYICKIPGDPNQALIDQLSSMAEEPPNRRGYQLCQAVRHDLEDSVHILLDHEDCHTFLNEAWELARTHHYTAVMWAALHKRIGVGGW